VTRETKVIGSIVALAAFVVGVVSGAHAGNPAMSTLTQSLAAMAVAYGAGLGIGAVISFVLNEHNTQYALANPVPEVELPVTVVEPVEEVAPALGGALSEKKK
jgi:hypothetical protein